MYTGHVGIALAARAGRRDVPLWLLVLAAQGCDWADVIVLNVLHASRHALWSHSLPAVAVGAVAFGLLTLALRRPGAVVISRRSADARRRRALKCERRPGTVVISRRSADARRRRALKCERRPLAAAAFVAAVYASHFGADLLTGFKPTWPGGPVIGLELYERPLIDLVLEAAVVLAGWLLYRRSLPARRHRGPVLAMLLAGLLALQTAADAILAGHDVRALAGPDSSAADFSRVTVLSGADPFFMRRSGTIGSP